MTEVSEPYGPARDEWGRLTANAQECAIQECSNPKTAWMAHRFTTGVGLVFPACDRHIALIELVEMADD